MEVVKINPRKPERKVLEKAVNILKKGGVIVYPTETCYGLGADAENKSAVKRIFKIKKRKFEKSFLVLVSSLAMAKKYVIFNKLALKIAKKFWPGPLTLVLEVKDKKKFKSKTLGLRISSSKICQALVKKSNKPLISTSANLSGQPPIYSISEFLKQFKNKKYQPDLILDAGRLPKVSPSTIIDLTKDYPKILREGPIERKSLLNFLKK